MRILRYLAPYKGAVVAVLCLLLIQAGTSLSAPWFTAQIVDIGIQQAGVERVAVDAMTSETYQSLSQVLKGEDLKTVEESYTEDKGIYVLNEQGKTQLDKLDAILLEPLVVLRQSDSEAALALKQGLSGAGSAANDTMSSDSLFELYRTAAQELQSEDSKLLGQKGISAAQAELREAGVDLDARQVSYILRVGCLMLVLAAIEVLVSVLIGYLASQTAAKIGAGLRSRLFHKVVSFSEAEVQKFSTASLITRGTNDIQLISIAVVLSLRMMLFSPILALGGIIMVSLTNVSMAWVVFCAVAAVLVLVAFLLRVAMPKFKKMQLLIDRVNLVSREILTGLPVIRAFDRQAYEEDRFDVASKNLMRTQLFTNRVMTFMMPAMTLIMNITSVAIVWVGGLYINEGVIQTGDLIAFISYSMVIITSFLMLGMIAILLPRADVAAGRVNEVLETRATITDKEDSETEDALLCAGVGGVRIAFDSVSFCYENSQEYVLKDISFVAEPGKTTALIGSTGSGKSTVLKLIERFYDVVDGSITIDGIDVRAVSQSALRSQLGYVPQQAFLFSGTIASNIAYGEENLSEERCEWALKQAQAYDFVREKEEGIEAEISQGGTNVSGGQRQRLAIARALASNARAFLFDDSFSALDYKTDAALRQSLARELSDKTVVIVAQRIATVLHADLIVVLDEGRIVGQGTHEELLATCKQYQEIAYSQLSEKELKGGGCL